MHQLKCLGDVHVLEYADVLSPQRSRCAFEESISNQMATLKPKRIFVPAGIVVSQRNVVANVRMIRVCATIMTCPSFTALM